jgi:hypothetical protein
MLYFTLTGNVPDTMAGIVFSALSGFYTYYLFNGGRTVYVPVIVMVVLLAMVMALFSGDLSFFGRSKWATAPLYKLKDIPCKDYLAMSKRDKLEIGKRFYDNVTSEGDPKGATYTMETIDSQCTRTAKKDATIWNWGN